MELRVRRGGAGGPTLLLLHGLGATGDVWDGVHHLLVDRWAGGWDTPDLPGHGGSAPLDRYSFGHLAAAVATVVSPGEPVIAVGHSLGGVVALTLASGWFGVPVVAACGIGIKVTWTEAELARAGELAARPRATFATREEAAQRHLRVAGLGGLLDPGDARVAPGMAGQNGEWRLTLDPAAFGVGAPDMPGLLAAARVPVILAAGEHDEMSPASQLRALDSDAVILPGLGHNAHVEDPAALWPIVERLLALS